jgi:hypothetical protein
VLQPDRYATHSLFESVGRPRLLIGAGVAVIAGATLGAAALLVSSTSSGSDRAANAPVSAVVEPQRLTPAASAVATTPRVADRWWEDATTAAAAKPVLSAPPAHDAWYLDRSTSQAPAARAATTPRVADRWYEEATTAANKPLVSVPPTHDAWYLDNRATLPAVALSEQARDTWYLDGQRTTSLDTSSRQRHVVDRWYFDPAFSGQGQADSEGR